MSVAAWMIFVLCLSYCCCCCCHCSCFIFLLFHFLISLKTEKSICQSAYNPGFCIFFLPHKGVLHSLSNFIHIHLSLTARKIENTKRKTEDEKEKWIETNRLIVCVCVPVPKTPTHCGMESEDLHLLNHLGASHTIMLEYDWNGKLLPFITSWRLKSSS